MKTQINPILLTEQLLAEQQSLPVLYTVAGSRGYGIATESSDYDLRGVHLPSKSAYYHFLPQAEVLERVDIAQGVDLVSYSWDKFLNMLLKSNPSAWELWGAGEFYLNFIPNFAQLRLQTLPLVDLRGLYLHYLSLLKSHIALIKKKNHHKPLFYALRGLICAKIILRGELPRLNIADLSAQFAPNSEEDKDISRFLSESLRFKQQEPQTALSNYQQVFFTDMLGYYHQQLLPEAVNLEDKQSNPELTELLQAVNLRVKTQFYG